MLWSEKSSLNCTNYVNCPQFFDQKKIKIKKFSKQISKFFHKKDFTYLFSIVILWVLSGTTYHEIQESSYHRFLPTGLTPWSYLLVWPPGLTNWSYHLVLPPVLTTVCNTWSYHLVLPPGLTTWSYHLVLQSIFLGKLWKN